MVGSSPDEVRAIGEKLSSDEPVESGDDAMDGGDGISVRGIARDGCAVNTIVSTESFALFLTGWSKYPPEGDELSLALLFSISFSSRSWSY